MENTNSINLIYKTTDETSVRLFGSTFVKNNQNNIELIINGNKSKLEKEYILNEGDNNVQLIIKNELTNLSEMFKKCNLLSNIEGLKNLNVSKCTNFKEMFSNCESLTDIKPLENWNVSNCTNFSNMFRFC